MTRDALSALSHWFPKLEAAKLPVPQTLILNMSVEAALEAMDILDFESKTGTALSAFVREVATAAKRLGFPAFLRTDHTSGKHQWDRTCYLTRPQATLNHILALIEYSLCADLVGLPYRTWAVREFLPTKPAGSFPGYSNLPLVREFRFFVDDGKVTCWHPYWGARSYKQGRAITKPTFNRAAFERPDNLEELTDLAERAGAALGPGGAWSVDLLETERGWYITDMAEAHRSGHDDCPNEAHFKAGKGDFDLNGWSFLRETIEASK